MPAVRRFWEADVPGLLDGKIALVTGAGSGIGAAIAKAMAEAGARIVAVDVNGEAAGRTAQAVGGGAKAVPCDVTDRTACDELAATVGREVGAVGVLVNNAGIIRRGRLTDADARHDWDATLAVNLDGPYNMVTAFLDQLRETKGAIVNIGSIQSFVHLRTPSSAAYTTSKHGVLGFTKALAAELGKDGVRVNAIGPGFIETPLNAAVRANNPALVQVFLDHTPLGRAGKPEDIVGPAIFLASDLSQFVTGTILMADGGYRTV